MSVEGLAGRAVEAGQLGAGRHTREESLYRLEWVESPGPSTNGAAPRLAVLGDGVDLEAERYEDFDALRLAVQEGAEAPDAVLVRAGSDAPAANASSAEIASAARAECARTLALLKAWVSEERLAETRLVVVTRNAVAAAEGEAPE